MIANFWPQTLYHSLCFTFQKHYTSLFHKHYTTVSVSQTLYQSLFHIPEILYQSLFHKHYTTISVSQTLYHSLCFTNIIPQSLFHKHYTTVSVSHSYTHHKSYDFWLLIKPQCQELIPYNCTGFPLTLIPVVNS
jgi:hypothetical protein